MSLMVLRCSIAAVAVLVCAAAPGAQQPMPQPAPVRAGAVDRLVGRWTFDDSISLEDQKNWRRPVNSRSPLDQPNGFGGLSLPQGGQTPSVPPPQSPMPQQPPMPQSPQQQGGVQTPRPSSSTRGSQEPMLRRTLRDLFEIAERYGVRVEQDRVTFTDDLDRVLVFTLDGKKQKHRLGATDFTSKASWDGVRLTLNLEAPYGFQMTQVFVPSEDGDSLFEAMVVLKPKFTPPIKNVQRVYRRVAASSTPAIANASWRSRHLLQRPQ